MEQTMSKYSLILSITETKLEAYHDENNHIPGDTFLVSQNQ